MSNSSYCFQVSQDIVLQVTFSLQSIQPSPVSNQCCTDPLQSDKSQRSAAFGQVSRPHCVQNEIQYCAKPLNWLRLTNSWRWQLIKNLFLSLAVDTRHGLTSNNTNVHYPGTLFVHTHEHTHTCSLHSAWSAQRQALWVTGMAGYLHGNGNVGPGGCQESSW